MGESRRPPRLRGGGCARGRPVPQPQPQRAGPAAPRLTSHTEGRGACAACAGRSGRRRRRRGQVSWARPGRAAAGTGGEGRERGKDRPAGGLRDAGPGTAPGRAAPGLRARHCGRCSLPPHPASPAEGRESRARDSGSQRALGGGRASGGVTARCHQ